MNNLFDLLDSPDPRLFQPDPPGEQPVEGEEALLRQREQDAVELDQLTEPDAPDSPQLSARRRFFLLELENIGLFDEQQVEAKHFWLTQWALPTLLSYQAAALEVLHYLDSPERRQWVEVSTPRRVYGAPVSVDWFRLYQEFPQGSSAYVWLARCEAYSHPEQLDFGYSGSAIIRIDGDLIRVRWRREDHTHAAILEIQKIRTRAR